MNNLQKGQSLFEVMVAVAISALIITAVVGLASTSIQNSSYSRDRNLASNYVQELNEWFRSQRDSDIITLRINVVKSPIWCFVKTSWEKFTACGATDYVEGTKFIRQSTLNMEVVNNKDLLEITTTVSWQDSKGLHQVSSSTDLSL
jgi:Tfp pilus assembly protein PilV